MRGCPVMLALLHTASTWVTAGSKLPVLFSCTQVRQCLTQEGRHVSSSILSAATQPISRCVHAANVPVKFGLLLVRRRARVIKCRMPCSALFAYCAMSRQDAEGPLTILRVSLRDADRFQFRPCITQEAAGESCAHRLLANVA